MTRSLLCFSLFILLIFQNSELAADPFVLKGLPYAKDSSFQPEKKHSAHKASIYSAVLPGLGQAYNRKYWKMPLVYAALGISGYFILYNRTEMRLRQNALIAIMDNDSTTVPDASMASIPIDVLRAQRDNYRTNRDYSIITFAGFYILNIIDAAVDAHFYRFNIDKPLAAQREKRWHLYSDRIGHTNAIGLSWRF